MQTTRSVLLAAMAFIVVSGLVMGCRSKSDNPVTSKAVTVLSLPNTSFAKALGVTTTPITPEQARAIAEAATGGTAISVEQEDMDGMQVYGVLVQVGTVRKDVKVRISDGAVLQIDIDDGIEGGGGEG